MDNKLQDNLKNIAKTIRGLSIDAINQSNSGHPGLPLGCAEIGAYLYGSILNHNPKNPNWKNRDRFILSAGHGSMLLYSCLHLAKFDVSLQNIKDFRQLHSPCAGHPEYKEIPGAETTTGPLGQGLATACGIALGQKINGNQYQDDNGPLFDSTTYVLVGDGCMMEGISSEASSFAAHINLDNLVVVYDSNDICLDGPTSECFTENTAKRYESYGWNVVTINGHDFDELDTAINPETRLTGKPLLVIAKTTIGYGSPNREGTSESHGKPLGDDEGNQTKESLGIPLEPKFHVPEDVSAFFNEKIKEDETKESTWNTRFNTWLNNGNNKEIYEQNTNTTDHESVLKSLQTVDIKPNLATRASSQAAIQYLSEHIPSILGGSADLSCSDSTYIKASSFITKDDYSQRNVKYGVREFAMSAIASGLLIEGSFRPFIGTFLTFSDYMKNGIRLAALMKIPVIYQFTHDSIFLGEDGPTHQPVEHLAALRSIPNLNVIRPADSTEVKGAWVAALSTEYPTAFILSRQSAPDLENSSMDGVSKGAYVIKKESKDNLDLCILATGTEVKLALDVADNLEKEGLSTRVVSFPCWELFKMQDKAYQNEVLGNAENYSVIEAQSRFGWHEFIGKDGICFTIDSFGASAPESALRKEYNYNTEDITRALKKECVKANA
jgi:transketolase